MIEKIVHISDVHIRRNNNREEEYRQVFERLYASLREEKPDLIVIAGDLFNEYLILESEEIVLASDFLNNLAEIAPVRIVRGNHDYSVKAKNRKDSVYAIVSSINNPKVIYYDETKIYEEDNILFFNWRHGDKNDNPWQKKHLEYDKTKITIDIFHNPINGSKSVDGFEFKKKSYYSLKDLRGQISLLGDIHKYQAFDNGSKAYSSSLIAQNFPEGNTVNDKSFHGYLLWDIQAKTHKKIEIKNDYSYQNIIVNPYTDFDDLSVELEFPTKFMKIRVIWRTLPSSRSNKDNERKITKYLIEKYPNTNIYHKNEFLEEEKIDTQTDLTIQNINDRGFQHQIFKEYLLKIGHDEQTIQEVLDIDDIISQRINIEEITDIEWNPIKLKATNFMSYESLDIDFRELEGLTQISGENGGGKTTILKSISYALYNKTLETLTKVKFGDSRYLNINLDVDFCEVVFIIEANNSYYGIKRRTDIEYDKQHEIKGAPTKLTYYKLNSPDDELLEDINSMNEENRNTTQAVIEKIIGTFDNFQRICHTTSDNLNQSLSVIESQFLDSLLYDSNLDLFDIKLKETKEYEKELNSKNRITCNVETTELNINKIDDENKIINETIINIENIKIPEIQNKITIGNDYIETQTKSLNKISDEIYNLNIDDTNRNIKLLQDNINDLEGKKTGYLINIKLLKETYDSDLLDKLIVEKSEHKENENKHKIEIKDFQRKISDEEHKIEIINGEIFTLTSEGKKLRENLNEKNNNLVKYQELIVENKSDVIKYKEQIKDLKINIENHNKQIQEKNEEIRILKENKTCPTCSQALTQEHLTQDIQNIINDKINGINNEIARIKNNIISAENIIKQNENSIFTCENRVILINEDIRKAEVNIDEINKEMIEKGKAIKVKQNESIPTIKKIIEDYQKDIKAIEDKIKTLTINMEVNLKRIGELTNDKNDVEKRKGIQNEIDKIPLLITIDQQKIDVYQKKINEYNRLQTEIKENVQINLMITAAKEKLKLLETEKENHQTEVTENKTKLALNENKIKELKKQIEDFKKQERQDELYKIYKTLIHRDSLPKQLLVNQIIPRINNNLKNLLTDLPFIVWLDPIDVRLKFAYTNRIDAVIDCISASGMERTFGSIALKTALKKLNRKSRPNLVLLDEIMGKLVNESVENFVNLLHAISNENKVTLFIEHNHDIQPDHIINVVKDERGVSSLTID